MHISDEPVELKHPFIFEVDSLVLENYGHTLRSIEQHEAEDLATITVAYKDDLEGMEEEHWEAKNHYERLRVTAVHLALVNLVIRLEHWVNYFKPVLKKRVKPTLVNKLKALNRLIVKKGKKSPVEVGYFNRLTSARNSVVHGDSKANWFREDGGLAEVAARYTKRGKFQFTEIDLREAVKKAHQQVSFYTSTLDDPYTTALA